MRKQISIWMSLILMSLLVFAGCGVQQEVAEETETTGVSITLLNIKSEINEQMEALAQAYQAETGVEVKIMNVPAGVDAQATLKGYYLSDQMPDIIACEAAGFSNWEGLLMDMSD